MTYDQWFKSQQGIAYEGQYLFAEAAWVHQLTRIIDQQDTINQLQKDLAEREAEIAKLRDVLSKIEYLESDNGCILSAGECSSFATEALSTPPSTSYLEQWERERYQVVAWEYEGESWFDGGDWHKTRQFTGIKEVAEWKSGTIKRPTPLYARKD